MTMFKKVAGKAKPVSKKEAEKLVKASRQNRILIEESEDEQPAKDKKPK